MTERSLYEVIGIVAGIEPKDISADDIKAAYKVSAHMLHPDRDDGSVEAFQELNAAYRILKDPKRRAQYDATGSTNQAVPIEREAQAGLARLFQQAIAEGIREEVDAIKEVREGVKRQLAEMQENIIKLAAAIEDQGKLQARMTYDGDGANLFVGVIQQVIEGKTRKIEQTKRDIEVGELILVMLDDYSCSVVEKPKESDHRSDSAAYFRPTMFGGIKYENSTA